MKRYINRYFLLLGVIILLGSCEDEIQKVELAKVDVEDPTAAQDLEFDVQLEESIEVKVGDVVHFNISGNADLIDFYSGAFGNAYAYKDQDRFYDVLANLSFRTGKSPNNNTEDNWNCAQLVYSTDFNGERTGPNAYTNAVAATWKPIPHEFAITAVPSDIAVYTDSGVGDISAIFAEGVPVYLAWHCTTQAESNRVQFRVIGSSIQGVVIDNAALSEELYTQGQLDFKWAENPASAEQPSNRPTVSSTQLQWSGIFGNKTVANPSHPLLGQFKEGYAISAPLELPQFNAGKDKPTLLVPKNDGTWATHEFIYTRPGVYEVVFVAARKNTNDEPITKTLTVTVTE